VTVRSARSFAKERWTIALQATHLYNDDLLRKRTSKSPLALHTNVKHFETF
jgi:hypothetical protein